eukprot:gene13091-biopygen11042
MRGALGTLPENENTHRTEHCAINSQRLETAHPGCISFPQQDTATSIPYCSAYLVPNVSATQPPSLSHSSFDNAGRNLQGPDIPAGVGLRKSAAGYLVAPPEHDVSLPRPHGSVGHWRGRGGGECRVLTSVAWAWPATPGQWE